MTDSYATNHRRRTLAGLAVVAVGAALLTGCGSSAKGDDGALTVRTDVQLTGATLPLIVGVEEGIYSDHGLKVDVKPGTGSVTTIQTVANGSTDIGYADAGALVQAAGKGAPVVMVADLVQRSPLAVFTKATSGLDSPKKIVGKTGGYTAGSAPETLFPAYAKAVGIDPTSVKLDKVDVPARDSLFVTDKTQFTFGLTNVSIPNLESTCKCKLTTFGYADAGLDALSSGLLTSKAFAQKNPADLKKFLAATAEAIDWTNAHPDKAAADFKKLAVTSTYTPEVVKQQWLNSAALLHTTASKGQPVGCTAESDWASTIKLMEQYGDVAAGKVKAGDIATNKYLAGCSASLWKE